MNNSINDQEKKYQEELRKQVIDEMENGTKSEGVWVRATLESGGNKEETKRLYVKYRMLEIQDGIRRMDLEILQRAQRKKKERIKKAVIVAVTVVFFYALYY